MKILFEKYHKLHFPLKKGLHFDKKLALYIDEIYEETDESLKDFIILILNIIKDFFSGLISETELAEILHATYFNDKTKKYHEKPYLWDHNKLLAFISELTDISWMKEGSDYDTYKKDIKKRWKELLDQYESSLESKII